MPSTRRKTTQHILPAIKPQCPEGAYDILPAMEIGPGKVTPGLDSLAGELRAADRPVVLDGYEGVPFGQFAGELAAGIERDGELQAVLLDVSEAMLPPQDVEDLVAPYLGGDDPLFGRRCPLGLEEFFDKAALAALREEVSYYSTIEGVVPVVYGCGAALAAGGDALLLYADMPRNEIQYRFRAGSLRNLGSVAPASAKAMYKRAYFVDWPVLNRFRKAIQPRVAFFVDAQREDSPAWAAGEDVRAALRRMASGCLRTRPWFEPGAWGGQWIREHIPSLPGDVPNYAWSFELIVPENGILLSGGGALLELAFDTLLYEAGPVLMGEGCARTYGDEFPIRMDYLDTVGGGDLSVQCHPGLEYIRDNFGETIAQEESYYILDSVPGSCVHLGLREGAGPEEFGRALREARDNGTPLDTGRYIQTFPSSPGDLFLIPPGTLHSAGPGNLVLEISTTPYIFTFKMYDWGRLDLDGSPRPLNIGRALECLRFDRGGGKVSRELICRPAVLSEEGGNTFEDLPTHPEHSFAVRRISTSSCVDVLTRGRFHVINLVQGRRAVLQAGDCPLIELSFGETAVVGAGAGSYRMTSPDGEAVKFVDAFVKDAFAKA